jgi:hypothetical protein
MKFFDKAAILLLLVLMLSGLYAHRVEANEAPKEEPAPAPIAHPEKSVTDQQLLNILNNLYIHSGLREPVTLSIDEDPSTFAYVYTYRDHHYIVMGRNFLGFLDYDTDKIAAVMAHEIMHVVLGHTNNTPKLSWTIDYFNRMEERESDIQGQILMNKAGYNGCEAADIWLKFMFTYPQELGSETTHPHALTRYNYLRCS